MERDYATELTALADIMDACRTTDQMASADMLRSVARELESLEDQRAYWERRCTHWRDQVDHLRSGRV